MTTLEIWDSDDRISLSPVKLLRFCSERCRLGICMHYCVIYTLSWSASVQCAYHLFALWSASYLLPVFRTYRLIEILPVEVIACLRYRDFTDLQKKVLEIIFKSFFLSHFCEYLELTQVWWSMRELKRNDDVIRGIRPLVYYLSFIVLMSL